MRFPENFLQCVFLNFWKQFCRLKKNKPLYLLVIQGFVLFLIFLKHFQNFRMIHSLFLLSFF